jgi:hypothetical protein
MTVKHCCKETVWTKWDDNISILVNPIFAMDLGACERVGSHLESSLILGRCWCDYWANTCY